MDALDRVLQEDLNLLLDRLAADTPPGAVFLIAAERPDLRARADALETEAASCRAALLVHYARWRDALEALADIWSLAEAERREQPDEEAERPSSGLRAA
jgi:hypothetical protein